MIHHHIQKHILEHLTTHPQAHFAQMRPKDLENNIYTYHLHQLMKEKLVRKLDDGTYELTSHGKFAAIDISHRPREILEMAFSTLLLAVKNKEGQWLLRKRLSEPLIGQYGFVHGEPTAEKPITTTAQDVLKEKTGLSADFTPKGSGYIRFHKNGELESFTHFTLLYTDNATGTLLPNVGNGENIWVDNPDFSSPDMIKSMPDIVSRLNSSEHFFAELTYDL